MQLQDLLQATATDGGWRLGIGDSSPLGWATVAAYAAAAWLCGAAARRAAGAARTVERLAPVEAANQRALAAFWLGGCALLVLLAVNKQLDLQTLMTQLGRDLALAQGWYEERRRVQTAFVAGLAALGTLSGVTIAWWLRSVVARIAGPLLGLAMITAFVVVRAASFHHVDLHLDGGPLPLGQLLELGGIVLVGGFAGRAAAQA